MGRGPKATMSLTDCMVRAESIAGGGPLSGGSESLGRGVTGACAGREVLGGAPAARALLSWSQAAKATAMESSRIRNEIIFIFINFINPRNQSTLSPKLQHAVIPRGTLVLACATYVAAAGKHQDPSLRSG